MTDLGLYSILSIILIIAMFIMLILFSFGIISPAEGYVPPSNGGNNIKKECSHEWHYISSGAYSICTKCSEIRKGHSELFE